MHRRRHMHTLPIIQKGNSSSRCGKGIVSIPPVCPLESRYGGGISRVLVREDMAELFFEKLNFSVAVTHVAVKLGVCLRCTIGILPCFGRGWLKFFKSLTQRRLAQSFKRLCESMFFSTSSVGVVGQHCTHDMTKKLWIVDEEALFAVRYYFSVPIFIRKCPMQHTRCNMLQHCADESGLALWWRSWSVTCESRNTHTQWHPNLAKNTLNSYQTTTRQNHTVELTGTFLLKLSNMVVVFWKDCNRVTSDLWASLVKFSVDGTPYAAAFFVWIRFRRKRWSIEATCSRGLNKWNHEWCEHDSTLRSGLSDCSGFVFDSTLIYMLCHECGWGSVKYFTRLLL